MFHLFLRFLRGKGGINTYLSVVMEIELIFIKFLEQQYLVRVKQFLKMVVRSLEKWLSKYPKEKGKMRKDAFLEDSDLQFSFPR